MTRLPVNPKTKMRLRLSNKIMSLWISMVRMKRKILSKSHPSNWSKNSHPTKLNNKLIMKMSKLKKNLTNKNRDRCKNFRKRVFSSGKEKDITKKLIIRKITKSTWINTSFQKIIPCLDKLWKDNRLSTMRKRNCLK